MDDDQALIVEKLKSIEAQAKAHVRVAADNVKDARDYVQQLEDQLRSEQLVLIRLKKTKERLIQALDACTVARVNVETLFGEEAAEAPKVPDNVHPIRTVEAKATAPVGIGAAVKQARKKKPRKLTPEQEKREKLKATKVSGTMGFAGAEKPGHL
jgi:hypothetical protein